MGYIRRFISGMPQYSFLDTGLVNYVSNPGATAFDRALTLAEAISKNGTLFTLRCDCKADLSI